MSIETFLEQLPPAIHDWKHWPRSVPSWGYNVMGSEAMLGVPSLLHDVVQRIDATVLHEINPSRAQAAPGIDSDIQKSLANGDSLHLSALFGADLRLLIHVFSL